MQRKISIAITGLAALFVSGCASLGTGTETSALNASAQKQNPPRLSAPKIAYTRWKLANGLQVIAIPDTSTANVTTSLWYEVGSKHDPQNRAGFAHLFEHILSRKTANMPYNLINRLTEDVGGTRNASTWIDRTNYFETVPAQYLETMLWTHRERMAFPVVDAEVFEKERAVVKEELRQRVLAPPYGRLQRFVVPENAYDVLPQRRPGIGSIEDLDAATLDDARGFHQAFYGPDTATLIVAGNFTIERLRALVDQYFADIPRRKDPVSLAITAVEPARHTPRHVEARAPNVPLPVVGNIWKGPSVSDEDAAAIEVISAILSSGDNSRLYKVLIGTGKAVNAVHFDMLSQEGGAIVDYAVLSPKADADEAARILASEIAKMREQKATEAELAEAKNEIFAAALSRRQTARGRAFELGEALVSTGDPDAADKRLAAIAKVSLEDVQRVANKWLGDDSKVTVTYRKGKDDPASYANPYPMPKFAALHRPHGEPRKVLPEGERNAPPGPSAAPKVDRADFVRSALANGIPLVVAQTSDVPIATITLVFPGGDASDPKGRSGVASLAASLAEKGTPSRNAEAIAARLESLGARISASTNADGTFLSLTAPVINLADAGEVFADIVRSADYDERDLARERARALDALAATLKDPGALASLVAKRVIFGTAPYGEVTNPSSLKAITRADLIAHRESWWHPAAMRIVVSGGIAPDAARQLLDSMFGDWRSQRPAPTPPIHPAGEELAPRTLVIDMPDAGQAAVVAGVRALSRHDKAYYDLWLANAVLGSGSRGRLFEEIRTKRGLSYGAYSSLGTSSDSAALFARAQTKNSSADEVSQVFLDQFALLGTQPVAPPLLAKRRLFLEGAFSRALETSGGFNGIVASLMLHGLEPDEAFALAARLDEVSPAEVSAIAAKYLAADRVSLVIVGDAAKFLDDLKAIRPQVEVIPFGRLDLSRVDLHKPESSADAKQDAERVAS